MGFHLLRILPFTFLLCSQFTACVHHTVPSATSLLNSSAVIEVHADMIGDIYPKVGEPDFELSEVKKIGKQGGKKHVWPFARAMPLQGTCADNYDPAQTQALREAELKKWKSSFKEIVVLIHGFNATNDEASEGYISAINTIQSHAAKGSHIGYVVFYWDGLNCAPDFAATAIWGNAELNSEWAGEKALRVVLDAIGTTKRTLVISHSRGAAVFLASIADPSLMYMDKKSRDEVRADTDKLRKIKNPALKVATDNRHLTAWLIAPAIGTYEFMKETTDASKLRGSLQLQANDLQQLHGATIVLGPNSRDRTLKKFLGIPGLLGSTWIGSNLPEAEVLARKASAAGEKVSVQNFSESENGTSHSFPGYMQTTPFKQLVKEYFSPEKKAGERNQHAKF